MPSRASRDDSPARLLAAVEHIRAEVRDKSATIRARWPNSAPAPGFRAAASNLAAYLALRQLDLAPVQAALTALGLSSLGRSEGQVMANLDAVHASLARIAGVGAPPYPSARRLGEGRLALARAQQHLFGARDHGPRTRVMVTLPTEAATDGGMLAQALVAAGMNCARINCAHDDAAIWRAMAANVRQASSALGRDCRVLMDIGGPKCRIEAVHHTAGKRLFRGDHIALVQNKAAARKTDKTIATITFPDMLARLGVGAEVSINDGRIGTKVIESGSDRVVLEVTTARDKGERLRAEKGVNFPGTTLDRPPLTDTDRADLDTVAAIADIVGFSFVQHVADIRLLRSELSRRRDGLPTMPLMLKIETGLAVQNLPDLIMAAGTEVPVAVMIARGDLAVELGFARLSEIQEEIMWLCEAAHVPVVWATQVLDSLVSEGMPTRAEATDAAMSQRAECVMLNKGPYVVDGVRFLVDILHRMDRHQAKKSARFGRLRSWSADAAPPHGSQGAAPPGGPALPAPPHPV